MVEEETKVVAVNKSMDLGSLFVEDCTSYTEKSAKEINECTVNNLCTIYKTLFELKKKQKEQDGEDGPVLEYDKPIFQVMMPASKIVLPREKPAPKEK